MQIETTYDRLVRQTEDGKLTLSAICGLYDPSIDSRVHGNKLSAEAAVSEYRRMWISQNASAEISKREFLEVYADISLAIASDAHFHQLLDESWKSG